MRKKRIDNCLSYKLQLYGICIIINTRYAHFVCFNNTRGNNVIIYDHSMR